MTTDTRIAGDYMTRLPVTIGPDDPVSLAYRYMRDYNCRHLPVVSCGRVLAVLSERDLNLIERLSDVDIDELRVEEATWGEPYCATQDTPLVEIAATMGQRKLGSCVIVDGEKVLGILTTVDICRALVDSLTWQES